MDATNGGKKGDTEPHGGQPHGLAPLPGGSGWIETANGKPLRQKGKGETEVGGLRNGDFGLRIEAQAIRELRFAFNPQSEIPNPQFHTFAHPAWQARLNSAYRPTSIAPRASAISRW